MSPLNAHMKSTSLSNNSHAFAGVCGLLDCGKSLVKSNRIIKTRRSAGSVTQIMRHQPVHACKVARRYSVFEAKVKRRRNLEFAETILAPLSAFHSQR
jgi:hypothetical protein